MGGHRELERMVGRIWRSENGDERKLGSGKEGWDNDVEKWKGMMGGYREMERKDGRIKRSVMEGWKDIEKWKGRVGGYREMERKDGKIKK